MQGRDRVFLLGLPRREPTLQTNEHAAGTRLSEWRKCMVETHKDRVTWTHLTLGCLRISPNKCVPTDMFRTSQLACHPRLIPQVLLSPIPYFELHNGLDEQRSLHRLVLLPF